MRINVITIKNIFAVFAALFFASLVSTAQPPDLTGHKWQLTHINRRMVSTTRAFIEFKSDPSRFSGNAGCNRVFGDVKVAGHKIDFGAIASTKMACIDPKIGQTERAFTGALGKVDRFRRSGSMLEFLYRGKTVLKFKAVAESFGDLGSKKWIVDQIAGKRIRVNGTMPFVVFDAAKSSAGGNTGCNVFGGSYAISGDTIRIFDTVSTMRACIEDNRMTVERQFLDALEQANRFKIKDSKLLLYRKEKLLITFVGEKK